MGGSSAFAERLGAIALLVYARTEDVKRGVFEMTAVPKAGGQQVLQGKNLFLCRAGNKGAVCLPFRYHQSTLVVAAAHLPADGSRRSKVEKRNANLRYAFYFVLLSLPPSLPPSFPSLSFLIR